MEARNLLAPDIRDEEITAKFTINSTGAKCKNCNSIYEHTFLSKFTKHLQTSHDYDRIIKLENRIIQKGPLWKYIKLRRDSEHYECVLCKSAIANLDEEFSRRTHAHQNDGYALRGTYYTTWQLKYCERRIERKMKCNICDKNISIYYNLGYITRHISNSCKFISITKQCHHIRDKLYPLENGRRRSYKTTECKNCKKQFDVVNLTSFKDHLYKQHKHITKFENLNKEDFTKSCINLQKLHLDDLSYTCTICQQQVSETALLNHECKANNTVSQKEGRLIEYSVRMSNYLLKCAVCPKTYNILHCDNVQKVIDHVDNKCLGGHFGNKRLADKDEVWEHFEDISNTRAMCKLCPYEPKKEQFQYIYIKRTAFLTHIEQKHFDTFQLEKKQQSISSWKYIKYVAGISACVFCDQVVENDDFNSHVHDERDVRRSWFNRHILKNYEDWPWKYGTIFNESNYLSVRCDICRERIQIASDLSNMKNHLKKTHSLILQQDISIDAIADPSFPGGPSSLAGTQQQEEGIEGAARSSSLAAQQQDVDMSGTPAKQRKID